MARKFLTAIDLVKNELQNAQIQNLASAPASPVKGQIYMNSTDNTLYWWDGTAWVAAKSSGTISFGTITQEQTFGAAKADGVAVTAARSDHAHGNPTHLAADHSTIPISALAAATAQVSMGGFKIVSLADPAAANDAANKQYVDNAIAGLTWKFPVRTATTVNITLNGNQTVDGQVLSTGHRCLVKNQTNATENGIYAVNSGGAWAYATDADNPQEMRNAAVYVETGTTQSDTAWVMTTTPYTGSGDNQIWSQFAGAGTTTAGAGMTRTGNTLDVIGDATITVAADSLGVADNGVANTKLADMVQATIKGRTAGAGTGDPVDLTAAQVATIMAGVLTRKYAVSVGGSTSVVVNHALAATDVTVSVYRVASPFDEIECDIEHTDANNVTVRFAAAPAAAEYRVVVVG